MKILQVATAETRIPPDKLGGVEGDIYFLPRQLSEIGHEVTILGRRLSEDEPLVEQINGVSIVRLPVRHFEPSRLERDKFPVLYWLRSGINSILFTLQVNKYLNNKHEFDIVNTHVISNTFLLLILSRRLTKRIVYTLIVFSIYLSEQDSCVEKISACMFFFAGRLKYFCSPIHLISDSVWSRSFFCLLVNVKYLFLPRIESIKVFPASSNKIMIEPMISTNASR